MVYESYYFIFHLKLWNFGILECFNKLQNCRDFVIILSKKRYIYLHNSKKMCIFAPIIKCSNKYQIRLFYNNLNTH